MMIKIPFTSQPVYDYETKEIVGYTWRTIALSWDQSKEILGDKKYDWTTHSATDNKFYALKNGSKAAKKFLHDEHPDTYLPPEE